MKKYKFCIGEIFEIKAEDYKEALKLAEDYEPKNMEIIDLNFEKDEE